MMFLNMNEKKEILPRAKEVPIGFLWHNSEVNTI